MLLEYYYSNTRIILKKYFSKTVIQLYEVSSNMTFLAWVESGVRPAKFILSQARLLYCYYYYSSYYYYYYYYITINIIIITILLLILLLLLLLLFLLL